jgi:regulator of sirC expression with transglutaminase-like and TPR domain
MSELHPSLKKILDRLGDLLERVRDPQNDDWDPILLGLLLAKLEYEELDVDLEHRRYMHLADQIKTQLPQKVRLREKTTAFIRMFSQEMGFQGDTTNYYNPKNSFLNDVYLRRKGIPISLSLVFMGLARLAGLKTVGISFPGHFLVKMLPNSDDEEFFDNNNQLFIDSFEGGRILSVDDCKQRLEEWTRGLVPFGPEVLRVAHPRDILSRMLRNLRAIYAEKEDLPRLYWVLSALVEICPTEKGESLKERGFLMARMGRYTQAIEDLRAYLQMTSDPRKYEQVEKILRAFELQKETVN